MRPTIPAILMILATGCADQGPELELRAEMAARTAGVVLHDDGLSGAAAMDDQLCLFDAVAGEVVGDLELEGGDERLLDAWGSDALAATRDAAWLLPRSIEGAPDRVADLHAIDGRLLADGIALLHEHEGQCAVTFQSADRSVAMLTQLDCRAGAGFTADRASGTVFIADGSDVLALDATGAFTAFQGANVDLLTFNAVTGQLVGARAGESTLYSWDTVGNAMWERSLPGPAHDLDIAGTQGFVAVMASNESGGANFMMLDGSDGAPLVSWPTPTLADVSVSADGEGLALTTEERVYLYDVSMRAPLALPSTAETATLQPMVGENGLITTGTATGAGAAVVGTAALVALMAD